MIKQGSLAIGLGGGHAIAYGSFLGLWQALQIKHNNQDQIKAQDDAYYSVLLISMRTLIFVPPMLPHPVRLFRQIAEHLQAFNQPFHYCCIGVSRLSNTAAYLIAP